MCMRQTRGWWSGNCQSECHRRRRYHHRCRCCYCRDAQYVCRCCVCVCMYVCNTVVVIFCFWWTNRFELTDLVKAASPSSSSSSSVATFSDLGAWGDDMVISVCVRCGNNLCFKYLKMNDVFQHTATTSASFFSTSRASASLSVRLVLVNSWWWRVPCHRRQ